ncbi:NGG1p interacting factor NIF3 [Histomonas meleagridis]|uniref:NGG1p interacting factor NIF3 n=1 Tax=Histomonas meleagridis TaxID=135588 RepID=UPI00355AA01B|nr:NGG1p interacting factor NIF3 [Histomonas meleagridis]KAH0797887.1 NGG1p interacting factor NIF3 [Histomonas meleagridis]
MQEEKVYRFDVSVPPTHIVRVKEALANAGAGQLGKYDSCMWTTNGLSQYRSNPNGEPYTGVLQHTEEAKIECIVRESVLKDVIAAMKSAHPYECPPFQYWEVNIKVPQ